MPKNSKASSLRNWIHVKRITQPWFSSHSSSSRLHRELICGGKIEKEEAGTVLRPIRDEDCLLSDSFLRKGNISQHKATSMC